MSNASCEDSGETNNSDAEENHQSRHSLDGLHFGISREEVRYSRSRKRQVSDDVLEYERWRLQMLDLCGVEINLDGHTFEAITREAERIKFGEEFNNFDEFDFALDCWQFLHIRATHRKKHRQECRVRICQYGATMCSRKPYSADFSLIGGIDGLESTGSRSILTQPARTFSQFSTGWRGRAAARNSALGRNGGSGNDESASRTDARVSEVRHRWENGRCGEKVRYSSAGKIKFLCGNAEQQDGPVSDPCKWRVRAHAKKNTEKVTITKCVLQHTCPSHLGYWRCTQAEAKFLATILCHRVKINPRIPVQDLVEELRISYSKRCSYYQVWRGRELAKDWLMGAQALSYNYIPALLFRILEVDNRALVDWSSFPHNPHVFRRAFICPSATRDILPSCQPVVAIDACHSKNRKYPTQIFLATALDGANQAVVLAFAVAPVESEENWTWFLENFKTAMGGISADRTVFINDRQKGLLPAVAEVFPGIASGFCAHHIEANVRSRFGKRAEKYFKNILYSENEERYNQILNGLDEEGGWQKDLATYLRNIPPSSFCQFAFPLSRAGKVTSNVVESANAVIVKIRNNAPFKILYDLWYHVMQRFTRRRKLLGREREALTQHARARYAENEARAGRYVTFESSQFEASVQMNGGRQNFIVKHGPGTKPSCSCWEYQEMLWPCAHVIAWDNELGLNPVSWFDILWHTSTLERCYATNSLPSVALDGLTPIYQSGAPPIAVRRGRHRVVRIPSGGGRGLVQPEMVRDSEDFLEFEVLIDEETPIIVQNQSAQEPGSNPRVDQAEGHVPQVRTKRGKCSVCKQSGHNRRRCPLQERTPVLNQTEQLPAHMSRPTEDFPEPGDAVDEELTVRLTGSDGYGFTGGGVATDNDDILQEDDLLEDEDEPHQDADIFFRDLLY